MARWNGKEGRDWLVAAAKGPAAVSPHALKASALRYGLAPATLIATRAGPVPLEWLRPGDDILTRDNGYRPLLWIGQGRRPAGAGPQSTVVIEAGQFGPGQPDQSLRLAPDHGVLVEGARFVAAHGSAEVLAPAASLSRMGPTRPAGGLFHLVLAGHELMLANGIWVESLPAIAAFRLFPRRAVALCESLLADITNPLRPRLRPEDLTRAAPAIAPAARVPYRPRRATGS
ncbi:Hint domain-containing protein [Defluviimonas sp. SAOS-178_SWC]|uniref:Hint domain-containing protein n=1 Tax=Defluviimonas sp. SAOS-178_SWC TaxID=3121287 RepID=UPI0032215418